VTGIANIDPLRDKSGIKNGSDGVDSKKFISADLINVDQIKDSIVALSLR